MADPTEGRRHLAPTVGWIAVVLPLTLVLMSVVLSPASNWTARTTLAGFCILATARPDAALLVTTAFLGFGIILSHLAGVPSLRVTEVLVVASLAGYGGWVLWHGRPGRGALTGWLSLPILLLAIAVTASAVVWQWVYLVQVGYPSTYLQALFQFLSRDYFVQPGDFAVLASSAVILEGLALCVVVAARCVADTAFFERALRMLALGGAGVAVMSAVAAGGNPASQPQRHRGVARNVDRTAHLAADSGLHRCRIVLRAVLACGHGHCHGIATHRLPGWWWACLSSPRST